MLANHASDNLFQKFDESHLGEHCEELGENTENVLNACKMGFWFTEEDRVINGETGQRYNYLVDIDMEGEKDPIMVDWADIHENLTDDIMEELDQHDVILVRDTEFDCLSCLVRPWAIDRIKILEIAEYPATGGTVKHFTPDELYDIAEDEYRQEGHPINQSEKEGIAQWACYSAENDNFHSEEDVRKELHAFIAEEKALMD